MTEFPKTIPVFPLSNFIIFPKTTVPLNIFEPRYIDMVNDSIKHNKFIGMIQPKKTKIEIPELYEIGCLGKITTFQETRDGGYLIELKGIIRFQIIKEVINKKKYRECEVNYNNFNQDIINEKVDLKFTDLELIFKNFKNLFEKRGYVVNWKSLENQSLDETINALAMASPFSIEEKQILLETKNLDTRKTKIAEILSTYTYDNFHNTTLQ